jgi:hypothetical protein
VGNLPPKKKRKIKNKNFYLYVIKLIRSGTKSVGKKVYVNQERLQNMFEMDRVGYSWCRSRRNNTRSTVFVILWWLGAKKLPFPSFLFWQLVLWLMTVTLPHV